MERWGREQGVEGAALRGHVGPSSYWSTWHPGAEPESPPHSLPCPETPPCSVLPLTRHRSSSCCLARVQTPRKVDLFVLTGRGAEFARLFPAGVGAGGSCSEAPGGRRTCGMCVTGWPVASTHALRHQPLRVPLPASRSLGQQDIRGIPGREWEGERNLQGWVRCAPAWLQLRPGFSF